MGGINSLSGLSNVSVDFQPTINLGTQNKSDTAALLPEAEANTENAQKPEKAEAKSVVRELDVLLLNAAGKSVSAGATKSVRSTGKALVKMNVLSQEEVSNLESLAKNATEKLKALDKFSGRELANALMQDKSGDLVWRKSFWGMNSAAKAAKEAIESQQALSEAIESFTERLAKNKAVDATLQNAFTEIQFQCDRRVSEIDAIVFKMYQLAQQDVVDKVHTDPKITAMLNATFKELIPREAIMSHGTAKSLELVKETFGEKMRPLAVKLDEFATNSSRVLSNDEILTLQRDMEDMKNALNYVRKNGINKTDMTTANGDAILGDNGEVITKLTEVDSSLLNEMERLLTDVSKQIADAKELSVKRSRQAFMNEVVASLSPENSPGCENVMSSGIGLGNAVISEFKVLRKEFVSTMNACAIGKMSMDDFDTKIDRCIAKFGSGMFGNFEGVLHMVGFDEETAKQTAKTVGGLLIIKAQFKELMASTERLKNFGEDAGLATNDVRKLMLGETGLSNIIEARSRGFKPSDVDPATEEQNIVGSRALGAGAAGKTYLLTTKSGKELVFKPELDSRIGLDNLALGSGNAYLDAQQTANLNLATQDTAKALGCDDVVVKYSVGSHDGQFGIFMEKAEGFCGEDFPKAKDNGGNGIAPADMYKITNAAEQTKIKGEVAQKFNKLMWLDLITGQGDRHWCNYFVNVDKVTREVTIKGIDNDAAFNSYQIGLRKYALSKSKTSAFIEELKNVCSKVLGWGWKNEYENRVLKDSGIEKNPDDTLTIDLSKAKTPEITMALINTIGLHCTALPEEIDQGVYDKLMEFDQDPSKKKEYLDTIKTRVSPDALKATEMRLNEAIAHAKTLKSKDKVYGDDQWRNDDNLSKMSKIKSKVEIEKSDGNKIEVKSSIDCVKNYCLRNCPSFYKRDFFHLMFKKP